MTFDDLPHGETRGMKLADGFSLQRNNAKGDPEYWLVCGKGIGTITTPPRIRRYLEDGPWVWVVESQFKNPNGWGDPAMFQTLDEALAAAKERFLADDVTDNERGWPGPVQP